jgi:LmbE family N-acetylglucosaminyl deacetylase
MDTLKESAEACSVLGVERDHIIFGDFEDTCIPDNVNSIHFLETFADNERIHAVFIPTFKDVHQDHRATANSCVTAFRHVPCILAYESPSSTATFTPTSFVDITDIIKIKWKALKCHKSQISQNKMYMEYRAMLCLSSFRGRQIGVRHAEAFETVKFLVESPTI